MGSGIGSIPMQQIVHAIAQVLAAAIPAGLKVETRAVPLSEIETLWLRSEGRADSLYAASTKLLAAARATATSCSTLPPLAPTAPITAPLSLMGMPPPKITTFE
jgi:hypothetical protein